MSFNKYPVIFFNGIVMTILLFTASVSYGQNVSKTKPLDLKDSIKTRYYQYPVKYPKEAIEKGIGGTVIITFYIDSTCSIINRRVKEGIGYGCDEAALSVFDKVEKDMKRDNKSRCIPDSMTFPVRFISK